ncbi:ABC transporter ATP-binding protein [Cutibacterium sp. V970]|uniref:ABC transporter ATP-binding protein n=1 Tax=Cutibacterium sp. V970 TaxID=3446481 RepID=UPI003EE31EF0
MTSTATALRTENLGWDVDGTTILSGINVEIRPNTVTMVIGLNGSGKTTLLHLLAGLRKPSAGRVWLGERDLAKIGAKQRSRTMALLEQNPSAHVELTVRDVVQLGRIPHLGGWGIGSVNRRRGRDWEVVENAMASTGIADLADRAWSSLSGGEKQRVQLARALTQEPEILLLDEPTNHLDLRHQIDLLERVRGLGLTTVTVIHDLDLAVAYADDLIVLDSGRMVAAGPTSEVLTPDLVRDHFGVDGEVWSDSRRGFTWRGLQS